MLWNIKAEKITPSVYSSNQVAAVFELKFVRENA